MLMTCYLHIDMFATVLMRFEKCIASAYLFCFPSLIRHIYMTIDLVVDNMLHSFAHTTTPLLLLFSPCSSTSSYPGTPQVLSRPNVGKREEVAK